MPDDFFGGNSSDDFFGLGDNSDGVENAGESGDINSFLNDSDMTPYGETPGDPKAVRKTALIAIICGVILVAVVFLIVNILSGIGSKPSDDAESQGGGNQQVTQEDTQNSNTTPVQSGETNQSTSGTAPNLSGQTSWVEFQENDEISFNENYIDSTFTVTSVKHYLKVVDGNSNIEVKSVLTGALAGFAGTYELEVPYHLGSQIDTGLSFDVSVLMGTTADGKSVVGEIVYE